ncbi:MAG: hypothetical protein JWR09_5539 [Mucilaginibacter sp.]|nr:hypothetical protein [Mucilaginibacter sp.]
MTAEGPDTDDKLKITVSGTVSGVCTIAGLIIKFSVETCDNTLLKILVIALFSLALILAIYIFNHFLTGLPNFLKYVVYLACIIFYFLLSAYVYTKKCVVPHKEVTEIRQGNVDNTVHADNSKNYYSLKQTQRTLKNKDLAMIVKQIPVKQARILVQYLKNKPIDTMLSNQIVNRLTQIGYLDVHLSPATNLPDILTTGKMTVLKNTIDTLTVYKIIVNPQQ